MNKMFLNLQLIALLPSVSLLTAMEMRPSMSSLQMEDLPVEIHQRIFLHSFENLITKIFEDNIKDRPYLIPKLIRTQIISWRKSLMLNRAFKELIEDSRFESRLKKNIQQLIRELCEKYNFFEALKLYFNRENPGSLSPERYLDVKGGGDMNDDDYLNLFKFLVAYTDVYLQKLDESDQKNPWFKLFGHNIRLQTLKGVLLFFLDYPKVNVNWQSSSNRISFLHLIVMLVDFSIYPKVTSFWIAHPQTNVNLQDYEGDTPLLDVLVHFTVQERDGKTYANNQSFKILLEHLKALLSDPKIDLTIADKQGRTPESVLKLIKDSHVHDLFAEHLKRKNTEMTLG